MKTIRIGSGAGYAGDRIEPAIDLIERGNLDYIIFECLAERTISLAQKAKMEDQKKGYNALFEYRFDRILDALKKHSVKVITNMGAANPYHAALKCQEMAQSKGLTNLKIAYVEGDDISSRLNDYQEYVTIETKKPLSAINGDVLSANGYIGCVGIVEALKNGADIVITGRVADPSLSLGPLVYEFGWSMDDYEKLGKGTWVGHLLECAGQVTGGYFADPGYKDVPELWNLGFPIIEVDENGDKRKEFVIFIVLSLIGLGLNQLLMWVFVSMIHIFYMVAKIIVTAIVMLYNFITRKLFLEKKHDS